MTVICNNQNCIYWRQSGTCACRKLHFVSNGDKGELECLRYKEETRKDLEKVVKEILESDENE